MIDLKPDDTEDQGGIIGSLMDLGDSLANDFEDLVDDGSEGTRRLAPTKQQIRELTLPHVLIKGQISFENNFGFLNKNQHNMMRFHFLMTILYLVIIAVWFWQMRKWRANVVRI